MGKAYWSIDDFLDQREPNTNLDKALADLRDQVIAEKVALTGWRCSWDRWGCDRESNGYRETIPAPALVDWKFELLPDETDFVLIHHDACFLEARPSAFVDEVNNFGGGVAWVKAGYDEKLGPAPRVHGWGELLMRVDAAPPGRGYKSEPFQNWLAETYPKGRPVGMTDKEIARQYTAATGVKVHPRTISRARGGK
jgi:hypothetical protein